MYVTISGTAMSEPHTSDHEGNSRAFLIYYWDFNIMKVELMHSDQ